MKFLVSTRKMQGVAADDYSHTLPGEPLFLPAIECGHKKRAAACGCNRAFIGVSTAKATTTGEVMDCNRAHLIKQRVEFYTKHWHLGEAEAFEFAAGEVDELYEAIKGYPVGTIVRRRGDNLVFLVPQGRAAS